MSGSEWQCVCVSVCLFVSVCVSHCCGCVGACECVPESKLGITTQQGHLAYVLLRTFDEPLFLVRFGVYVGVVVCDYGEYWCVWVRGCACSSQRCGLSVRVRVCECAECSTTVMRC